jgi:hypothetical protein
VLDAAKMQAIDRRASDPRHQQLQMHDSSDRALNSLSGSCAGRLIERLNSVSDMGVLGCNRGHLSIVPLLTVTQETGPWLR